MLKIKIKSGRRKTVKKDAYRIFIQGAVQGVGFRPFIYRLAKRMNLTGWVENTSTGIIIEVEAEDRDKVYEFVSKIYAEKPKTAHIEYLNVQPVEFKGYDDFTIRESREGSEKKVLVLPDLTVCSQCLEELFNPKDRRYLYPFINCTQCGPRFTIIKDVPYDRKNTTMAEFKMCSRCEKEYHNPESRRFHAQPNACWDCGPQLQLADKLGKIKLQGKEAVLEFKKREEYEKITFLKCTGDGIPRHGDEVMKEERIGVVSSGNYSPCLKKGIALAYINTKYREMGSIVTIRGRKEIEAEIIKGPFVKKGEC